DWPGNVRQLSNIIQRACILAGDNIIREEDIQFDDLESQAADTHFEGTLEELKNSVIAERIKMFDGNKTRAAKSLNISLRSLQAKAKELGL
ncbi:MAG TPA: sigma-54-dependent Fis family transcriptional regulator, partial [Calditrichaeota bacterium]|nr:sigma-54-dependent Fis family transcriptional regulator [Calditrichota bacterium]